ncbi:MAG: hypothetical protein FWD62_09350 [Betaproteobacteria bacterium]|nr:hypothetical protein [Betaproteobacteria bacterium]
MHQFKLPATGLKLVPVDFMGISDARTTDVFLAPAQAAETFVRVQKKEMQSASNDPDAVCIALESPEQAN